MLCKSEWQRGVFKEIMLTLAGPEGFVAILAEARAVEMTPGGRRYKGAGLHQGGRQLPPRHEAWS